MKTSSRLICGALLGLCALSVTVRGAVADDTADWMAEMRRQNDEFNRQAAEEREARDRFLREAYEEREARDKFNREAQEAREAMDKFNREAQAERDARDKWNREVQQARESWQKQQEWDDWLNRLTGSAQSGGQAAGPVASPPKAPVARAMPAPQVRLPLASQRRPALPNQVAFQQMMRQNQERARLQILQTRQQMTQGLPLQTQNPFAAPPQLPGRRESAQMILNPFVGSSP